MIQYAYNGDDLSCDPNHPNFANLTNWKPLITRFGYDQPLSEPVDFTFEPTGMQCLRIIGTELSQDDYGARYMQLNEIELLNGETQLSRAGAATSSGLQGWGAEKLVDDATNTTWSSLGHTEHLVSTEWAVVLLPEQTTVDKVRIYPRGGAADGLSLGFPKDFVIQYAYNGDDLSCDSNHPNFANLTNWKPLITRFGYDQPLSEPVDFTFEPSGMQCLRIIGTELSQDDYGARYMQMSEIRLFNTGSRHANEQNSNRSLYLPLTIE